MNSISRYSRTQQRFRSIVEHVVRYYGANPTYILQILREIQEHSEWISPDIISHLETLLNVPRTKIEAVAGFYSFLYTEPKGRYRILFSDNITDRMLNNIALLNHLTTRLGVKRGQLSEDRLVSVDTTSCTGMCDQGPAILINNIALTQLTFSRIEHISTLIQQKIPLNAWPKEFFEVQHNIRRADVLLNDRFEPGEAITAARAMGCNAFLEQLKCSNLRGRGGAGFQTGRKWELCCNAIGQAHYVVCNADEGEPGTFKDRVLLTAYADVVFEGMTLCAYVIGAQRGFLYLRGEYRYLLEHLKTVLENRRKLGVLGKSIQGVPDFDFDIEIHLGAGAYICGEESALIESLEGKRGTPRNRPPFPVTCGYLNQPTVVNNVETFMATCLIARIGADRYASTGTSQSAGTKLLSISGDCKYPGIYEYPFGITVAEILKECGADDTQAVQISGASGICIAADEFDRKIAFEDIPTAGSFMIFNANRDMFEVAHNFTHFFAHESCGFCTPCRVGTTLLAKMMDKLHDGRGSSDDFADIKQLNTHLLQLSHCGLGHSACNPALETIAKFQSAYDRRLLHQHFMPAFSLDHTLAAARQLTHRTDDAAYLRDDYE